VSKKKTVLCKGKNSTYHGEEGYAQKKTIDRKKQQRRQRKQYIKIRREENIRLYFYDLTGRQKHDKGELQIPCLSSPLEKSRPMHRTRKWVDHEREDFRP